MRAVAQAVLLSNGAHVMSEDRTRIMFGEPPAIEVYRDWQRWVQEGVHAKLSYAEGLDAFQAGKIGMYLQTSAVQGSLLKAASGSGSSARRACPRSATSRSRAH